MDNKTILSELDSLIAYSDLLKEKATGLRRRLAPVEVSASRKRERMQAEINKVLAARNKNRLRKAAKKKQ